MTTRLLPAPRSVNWTGGTCPSNPIVAITIDRTLPAQGYRLRLDSDGVRLDHADADGLRHGRATLAQLAAQGPLSCGVIADHPCFAVRGLMLDCSRDRIPTREQLSRLLTQMAAWKLNHLQLYSEHAVIYRGHEAVAPVDGLTLDELAGLAREAVALGIVVAGNQNCFGHWERWFRYPAYEALAELPGDPGHHHRCGCRSLAPANPAAITLVSDLITQQAAVLGGELFNIGGDETWDLGLGRSRALVERVGYAAVYGCFLGGCMDAATAVGAQPMFWADIVLRYPEAARHLDRNAIALDWGYSGHHDFSRSQATLAEAGFAQRWVCPGTSCWNSWGGQSDERRANLLRAARQGLAAGATGFLVAVWGDGGHRQVWPASLAGIAEAAHRAWSGPEVAYDPRAGGLHAFGCAELGPWLDALGQLDRPLRDGARWETAYKALHERIERHGQIPWAYSGPTVLPGVTAASEWEQVTKRAHELRSWLPSMTATDQSRLLADECRQALTLIVLGAERGGEVSGGAPRPADWESRLDAAMVEHRRLWRQQARPGGLADSVAAFRAPLG